MGCDMHLSLERCVRSTPDAATLSARLTCLMLAKRATKVDKSATATTMLHIEIMLKGEGLGAALDEDEDDSQEDSNGAGSSAADAAATTSRRDVLGPHVVEGLAALEARLRQAGVSPAELRLIICFDN